MTEPLKRIVTRRGAIQLVFGSGLLLLLGGSNSAWAKESRKHAAKAQPKEHEHRKHYAIKYKLNGGANPKSQLTAIREGATVKVSKLKKPTRRGYRFAGWFKDAQFVHAAVAIYGKKNRDKRTLYVRWKPKRYSIAYHLDGGRIVCADYPEAYTVETPIFTFPTVVRNGYAFGGWYRNERCTSEISKVDSGSVGDLDIYAAWNDAIYWDKHLQDRCFEITELTRRAGTQGDSFVFITDTHVQDNVFYSPALISYVRRNTPVSTVVFGGDVLNRTSVKEEALYRLRCMHEALEGEGRTFYIRGNHDGNDQGDVDNPAAISDDEYRQALWGDDGFPEGGRFYYYRDNDAARIRYLFLDTGHPSSTVMDEEQLSWIRQRLLELESGWGVVVFMHQYFATRKRTNAVTAELSLDRNGSRLNRVIEDAFDDMRAEILCVISGHCHRDYSYRHSFRTASGTASFLAISTTCDAFRQAKKWDDQLWHRDRGSIEEQAFDVITINRQERRIYATRIGCGSSRMFFY